MHSSILVTGCSSGIGEHCARALKQRGYRVFAGVRKQEDAERLQQEGFDTVIIDLDDSLSIKKAIDDILIKTDGTLDAVFNNAGFLQAGAVEDLNREIDIKQFQTNVFGAMELAREVLPVMRKQGYGRFIQNSSILAIIPLAYCGAYNASKYALEGYLSSLRLELSNTPIHISMINPGAVTSRLRKNAKAHFHKHIASEQSLFHQAYDKLQKSYFDNERKKDLFNSEPEIMVKPLIHALESKRPKAHYYPGMAAKIMSFLRRVLPDVILDRVLASIRR